MKNSEKNSSKNTNNTNNNEVLSVETIKAQLKAACQEMTAKETKDYIKGLAGYELRLTGQKPTQHYTIFYGEVRICNVEQVQGIKADGTARGCISVAKVKSSVENMHNFFNKFVIIDYMTEEEFDEFNKARTGAAKQLSICDNVLKSVNNRIAEQAKEAAAAKRAAAAKERAQNKMNNKLKESSDNEKIAAIAAVLDISFDEAKIIFEKKRAQKTA